MQPVLGVLRARGMSFGGPTDSGTCKRENGVFPY